MDADFEKFRRDTVLLFLVWNTILDLECILKRFSQASKISFRTENVREAIKAMRYTKINKAVDIQRCVGANNLSLVKVSPYVREISVLSM